MIAILITLIYCVASTRDRPDLRVAVRHRLHPALLLGTGVALSYLVVSGTLGASRNQQLHYVTLILCFIIPLM